MRGNRTARTGTANGPARAPGRGLATLMGMGNEKLSKIGVIFKTFVEGTWGSVALKYLFDTL